MPEPRRQDDHVHALDPDRRSAIQRALLDWYGRNRRDLPWRRTRDPYAILVSEVMLQQTGVERVAPAFERFLERFPTFEALAAAPRVDVLRAWAGLGYNRRAVHLHELARAVVARHGGILPADPAALRALPGVGPYTQAAIESLIFGRDAAALDTNVRRVVNRLVLAGLGTEREVAAAASALVPPGRSADWNQALMDFGSLQCAATSPACLICPLVAVCRAAPVPPGRPARALRERPASYVGSRRYYRGRAVAALRDLPPGAGLTLPALLERIKPGADGEDLIWVEGLIRDLAADGLARIEEVDGEVRAGPP